MFAVVCAVPSSPHIRHILSRNGTAAMIKWDAPKWKNGKLLGYQLYIFYNGQKTSVNITNDLTNIYQITGLCMLLSFFFLYIYLHLYLSEV